MCLAVLSYSEPASESSASLSTLSHLQVNLLRTEWQSSARLLGLNTWLWDQMTRPLIPILPSEFCPGDRSWHACEALLASLAIILCFPMYWPQEIFSSFCSHSVSFWKVNRERERERREKKKKQYLLNNKLHLYSYVCTLRHSLGKLIYNMHIYFVLPC